MRRVAVALMTRLEIWWSSVLAATARVYMSGSWRSRRWLAGDQGQSFAEYAVIFTLVLLVAVVGLSTFGGGLGASIANSITAVIAMF